MHIERNTFSSDIHPNHGNNEIHNAKIRIGGIFDIAQLHKASYIVAHSV
jgi:hypothetical protein